MAVLYSNNASSTLSASITSTATSLSVASGAGALFPAPSGSDYFYITLVNSAGAMEIMKVTARSADTLTVVRGQDGTTGVAWAAGDRVELRFTRAMLDDIKGERMPAYGPSAGSGGRVMINLSGNPAWSDINFTYDPIMGQFRAIGLRANMGDSAPTWNFNNILHAGNYSSYALPLGGGTLTGSLHLNVSDGLKVTYDGTDGDTWYRGWGVESNRATTYFRPVNNSTQTLRIGYSEGSQSWDGVRVDATVFTHNGHTVLNSNNYSSFAATSSHGHIRLNSSDTRTISPSSHSNGAVTAGFTSWANNNTGNWADYLHFRSYTDGSGGNDNLVMFNKGSIGMRIWQQSFGSGAAYSSYVDVLHSGNYTNYTGQYVLKSGDTMTGTLQFNSLSNSVIAQHDGTGAYWRGRIISRNSDANRAVFLGNYNSKAGLFAHVNALDGWAPLYLNTLGDNGGSTVYLPHNATYTLDSANNAYAVLTAANYTDYKPTVLVSPNGASVVAADAAFPSAGQTFQHSLALGPGGNDGHILAMSWANTASIYGAQIWLDTDPTNRMAIRSRNSGGTWNGWSEVLTELNVANYASVPGHTHSYLPLAGGTMNNGAQISWSGSYNQPNMLVANGDPNWTFGFYSDDSTLYYPQVKFHAGGGSTWNRGFRVFDALSGTAVFQVGDLGAKISGKLGLGCTPDIRLSVNGEAHISSYLYMGGTAGSYSSWGSRDYTTSGNRYINANYFEVNNYGYGSTWSLAVDGASTRYNGNVILHAGNYTNYTGQYVLKSGDIMSGTLRHGNNLARPVARWDASGESTGMVVFSFPGSSSNYGMVHAVFDIYEYNGNTVSTVIVGGHNWNGAWYNYGSNVVGSCGKTVRVGYKDGKYCIVFGGVGAVWSYGQIVLRKIQNGGYYDNQIDLSSAFSVAQTNTESFAWVSGDLRYLQTPGGFNAVGAITQNGNQVLHAGNYTSYSPSLTGSGASGTWSINVTGSATSVGGYSSDGWLRKVSDASQFQIYGNSRSIVFRTDGTTNPHGGGAYPYIWFYGGSADADRRMIMNTSGQLWLSNYGWLHDAFAGASHTHNYMSADYSRPGGDLNSKLIPGNYGISYTESNRPADWGALIVGRSSDVVAQWYLDHNNAFWIRGGNPPAAGGGGVWNSWREVLHSGNYTNYAAPVSHTHNYVLKTGDTMTGRLTIDGSGWTTNNRNYSNEWIEFGNYSGLYSPNNGAHFYPNNGSYGSWRSAGSRNGWAGIEFDASNGQVVLMINPDSNTSGFHNNSYGWQFRWNNGTAYVYKNAYGGGTAATVLDSSNYSNYSLPLGGGTINGNLTVTGTLTAAGRNLAYSTTINMSSLDANTWYPVTIPLPANRRTTMRIENALNSNVPSWSTHGSGFSLYFEWISNGSGWGTIGVERTIVNWRQQFSNVTIVGGVTQMGYSSTEVIWLRGGGTYYFSADNIVSPAIQTSTYTVYGQSVSPSTSIQNDVWSQAGGRIGAYEFQAVGNMFAGGGNTVLHAGNYTNYVVGLGGGTLTGNLSISGSSTQILFTGNTAATLIQSFSGIDTKFSIYNSGTSIGISNALGTLNLVSPSGVLANGNTILHAGNYTSYGDGRYLRGDGTTPVTANNLNFGIGRYFGYTYIQTFSGENLHLNPSTSNGGDVYIRGNLALHAGNISSYVTSAPTAFNVVGSIAYLYRTNGGNNSALAAGVSVSGSTLFYCSTARTDSGYTGFVSNVGYNGSGIGRTTAFTASNGAGTFSPIGGTWRSLSYVSPAVYDSYGGTTYAGGLYVRVA